MKPVEKIFDEIIAQAKQGSCKTCRWCGLLDEMGYRLCDIQGNVNPIHFDPQSLTAMAYPGICDEGAWESDGKDMPECLAYRPSLLGIPNATPDWRKAVNAHRDFMIDLARAQRLHNDIEDNTLAKLTAKLNEATESLPVAVKE